MLTDYSPAAWETLHRMRAEGYPLDLDYLYRRYSPLQVFCDATLTEIVADAAGLRFSICLQLVAKSPVTITRLALNAQWHAGKVEFARRCDDHEGYYCLHPHFCEPAGKMLITCLRHHQWRLKPGVAIKGLVYGRCVPNLTQVEPAMPRTCTITMDDSNGYRFRYPVVITTGS